MAEQSDLQDLEAGSQTVLTGQPQTPAETVSPVEPLASEQLKTHERVVAFQTLSALHLQTSN